MAELGSIQFNDVNRTQRRVDRTQEQRALASALNVAEGAINEGVKASVTGDMIDAIDQTVAESEAINVENPEVVQREFADPEQAKLAQTIDRWKIQAEQGNSSQRTLAEIRIKEILNKAQGRYGWLAEGLQQRAGLVMAGSAELQTLGLYDAAAKQAGSTAQSDIQKLKDYAYKKWEDGGLGMSPDLEFGSPEWIGQYVEFDSLRQQHQANERLIGMTISNRDASAIQIESSVSLALQGKFSTVRASRHKTFNSNGFEAALAEAQKGEEANLDVLAQFHGTGAPIIIDTLEQDKVEARQLYNEQIKGLLQGSPSGLRVKAQLDDFIAETDSIISAFKSSVDMMPDALKQIATSNAIRGANLMRGMSTPHRNLTAFLSGPGKNLVEVAKLAVSGPGLRQANDLGTLGVGAMAEMFPNFVGENMTEEGAQVMSFITTGQGGITSDMTPMEINKYLDKIQHDTDDPYYVGTKTDSDELEAAFSSVDMHRRLFNAALETPEYATPEAAGDYLTGMNYSMRTFNRIPQKPEDLSTMVRSALSDDRLLSAIDIVGDDDQANKRRAFGVTAKEWYESTDPRGRQQKIIQRYQTHRIDNIPLSSLAEVDITSMQDEGVFRYEINAEKAEKLAQARLKADRSRSALASVDTRQPVRTTSEANVREQVRLEIMEAMAPVVKEVNESITISRNLDHASAINKDTRRNSNVKMQFFDELGWVKAFNYTSAQ